MLKGYFCLCNPNCPVLSGGDGERSDARMSKIAAYQSFFTTSLRNTGQTLSAMIL